ncbi:MAG: ROK family protein [Clostridiaceae bacterium]|nr:ROK family protein [Clostridiaceae bacterium]
MERKTSYALGIDIGGTNTKIGIIDSCGNISEFVSFPTQANGKDPNPFLERLNNSIQNILLLNPHPLLGIGISTHGYLDSEFLGPVVCHSTPSLKDFNLRGWAEKLFGLPAIVNNDLVSHSLAEYYYGSGKGSRRFLCMAVGTGFGVGVIIDGKPLRLVGGTTGDAGRLILDPNGPKCKYQVNGSAEALIGVANIERLARNLYNKKVSAYEVIQAAKNNSDKKATLIIKEIGAHLGHALSLLSAIFLPEQVAITGGIAEAGEVLLQACYEKFFLLMGKYHQIISTESPQLYQGIKIELGKFRGESGLLGSTIELFLENDSLLLPGNDHAV